MSKHTPGPWTAKRAQFGGSAFGIHGGADGATPVAMTVSNASPKGMEMARRGEIEANARLIAAAPALLEALRIAEQFMVIASDWNIDEAEINGEMRSTYDWLDVVRAAIAKATGEAS